MGVVDGQSGLKSYPRPLDQPRGVLWIGQHVDDSEQKVANQRVVDKYQLPETRNHLEPRRCPWNMSV